MSDEPSSISSILLHGTGLSAVSNQANGQPKQNADFIATLIRDEAGSHVFEVLISTCSNSTFSNLWQHHFMGDIAKLCLHPVCNFVISKCIARLDVAALRHFVQVMASHWYTVLSLGAHGILLALVERAITLNDQKAEALKVRSRSIYKDLSNKYAHLQAAISGHSADSKGCRLIITLAYSVQYVRINPILFVF